MIMFNHVLFIFVYRSLQNNINDGRSANPRLGLQFQSSQRAPGPRWLGIHPRQHGLPVVHWLQVVNHSIFLILSSLKYTSVNSKHLASGHCAPYLFLVPILKKSIAQVTEMEGYTCIPVCCPHSLPPILKMTWVTMTTWLAILMPIWQRLTWRALELQTYTHFSQLCPSCALIQFSTRK